MSRLWISIIGVVVLTGIHGCVPLVGAPVTGSITGIVVKGPVEGAVVTAYAADAEGRRGEVIGTSVMLESVDFAEDDWRRFWEDPVERRALQRAVADHRAVVIKAQVFVDVKANGRVERVSGTQWWPQEIWLDRDPTNQLIERAYDGRFHLGDLYGDLWITGSGPSRWEFYAAPFRVELSAELREILRDRWTDAGSSVRGG